MIAIIAGHTLLELNMGKMSDQLCKNGIHPPLFRRHGIGAIQPIPAVFSSNRFWAEHQLFN